MAKDPHYVIQVMEKIGSPLVASVSDVSARLRMQAPGGETDSEQAVQIGDDAEKVAALLGKSVQVALSLSRMLELGGNEAENDSVRLALTALAGPMLANQYRMSTRLPGDNEVSRIVTSLEAVMTFSDNFTIAGDANIRLEQLDKDFFPADPAQIQILYIQAMVPAVNAVAAFPFGQPERKLIQDITDRLIKRAAQIRSNFFADVTGGPAKKCELAILRSLSAVYSQCHFGEMVRLMSLPPERREQVETSLTPVWEAFEARAALLELLAEYAVPEGGAARRTAAGSGSSGITPPPSSPGQTPQQQATRPPAAQSQDQVQPNQHTQSTVPGQPDSQASNQASNQASQQQVQHPQSEVTPPAQPQPQAQAQPQTAPSAQQSGEPMQAGSSSGSPDSQQGGGENSSGQNEKKSSENFDPMSFFTSSSPNDDSQSSSG